jgi:hypothetical protein
MAPAPVVAGVSDLLSAFAVVHEEGLEPPHLAVPEPKSGASANSATRAIEEAGGIARGCGGRLADRFLASLWGGGRAREGGHAGGRPVLRREGAFSAPPLLRLAAGPSRFYVPKKGVIKTLGAIVADSAE